MFDHPCVLRSYVPNKHYQDEARGFSSVYPADQRKDCFNLLQISNQLIFLTCFGRFLTLLDPTLILRVLIAPDRQKSFQHTTVYQ